MSETSDFQKEREEILTVSSWVKQTGRDAGPGVAMVLHRQAERHALEARLQREEQTEYLRQTAENTQGTESNTRKARNPNIY